MTFPGKKYDLDPTGINPANRIIGEKHVLGANRGTHYAIAPLTGPLYNDRNTLRLWHNDNPTPLEYGVDYFGIVMLSDETAVFNSEIDEVLIVKGVKEGDTITLDYQNLGGLYQNHTQGLEDLWNAFLNDDRPIDWVNIIGRPWSYNPSYHLHLIDDVVGWQPVVLALERLTNAVTLRNIPAFEALIEWVLARVADIVSTEEIYEMTDTDKLMNFNRVLYAARTLNFNAITFRPEQDFVLKDGLLKMTVSSTNFPRVWPLYWEILHEDTVPEMFLRNSGNFDMESNEAFFYLEPNPNYQGRDEPSFRVVLRTKEGGAILCESKRIVLRYNAVLDWDYGSGLTGSAALLAHENSLLVEPTVEAGHVVLGSKFWAAVDQT